MGNSGNSTALTTSLLLHPQPISVAVIDYIDDFLDVIFMLVDVCHVTCDKRWASVYLFIAIFLSCHVL